MWWINAAKLPWRWYQTFTFRKYCYETMYLKTLLIKYWMQLGCLQPFLGYLRGFTCFIYLIFRGATDIWRPESFADCWPHFHVSEGSSSRDFTCCWYLKLLLIQITGYGTGSIPIEGGVFSANLEMWGIWVATCLYRKSRSRKRRTRGGLNVLTTCYLLTDWIIIYLCLWISWS